MKIIRLALASLLLLLAVPVWRSFDWISIIWPESYAMTLSLGLWSIIFLSLPLKLLRPKIHPVLMLAPFLLFWGLSFYFSPLTKMATNLSTHTHCGYLTYSGSLYPLSPILSEAFRDDLEARNQMCWLRKMISKIPEKFDNSSEVNAYLDLTQKRLMAPEIKYRVSLPFVLVFLGKTLHSWEKMNDPLNQFETAKMLMKGIPFWTEQYQHEISLRKYGWWNWPHSSLIQFEYGLIESNWEKIQIMVEEQ